jgi:hypothetical protein
MNGSKNVSAGIGLAKITDATRFLRLRLHFGIVVCGDEDDRSFVIDCIEPFAQFQPRHPFHLNVEYQAIKSWPFGVGKKCFGREIRDRLKVSGPQKSAHRAAKTLIIINNCDIDILFAAHNVQLRW